MSAPENSIQQPSSESLPSSFDDTEFFEEGRMQKLWRKIRQEPLIPVGCVATCYALYQASKSIRAGDHNQTNRMFRARIYAQGFTLVALVAGSIFYRDERLKRKQFERVIEDKKAAEKREKWLRELEARDNEDRAWRAHVEDAHRRADEARQAAQDTAREVKKAVEDKFSSKSVREQVIKEGWGPGTWLSRTHEAWKRI